MLYGASVKKYCFQLPSGYKTEAVWSLPYAGCVPVLHVSPLATSGTYLGTNAE